MISTKTWIHCDDCNKRSRSSSESRTSGDKLRRSLEESGWTYRGHKDRCPECTKDHEATALPRAKMLGGRR